MTTDDQLENFLPEVKCFQRITIPHGKDFSNLLNDCDHFIRWCYENDKKDMEFRFIPRSAKRNLEVHVLSGILFLIGKRNRPKVIPEPFALLFGKRLERYFDTMVFTPLGFSIPRPDLESIEGFESIRWVILRKDTLEYVVRCYRGGQFNINQIPMAEVVSDGD